MEALDRLVARAQLGDLDAFASIAQRFQDMAVAYAYARLGDFHLAEDAAQEAFASAFRNLAQLREPAAFPGWFRTVVYKHCDRITRRKQVITVSLEAAAEVASERDPVAMVEYRTLQAEVSAAIAELPESQRVAVTLFYIGGYSLGEIGCFLGVPVGTVKTRLHLARKRLQRRMLDVVQDNLREQRPSRDEAFTGRLMRLFTASEQGDAPAVTSLLDDDPGLVNAVGKVEHRLYIGEVPPLHIAVMHNRRDVIDLLLARGADINMPDKAGMTALQNAIDLAFLPDYDWRGMADFLIARGAEVDVFAAMWMGDQERLAALLKEHPEVANARGPNGISPIAFAGSVEQARLLLDHGADLFAHFDHDQGIDTPIKVKARFPDETLRYMIERGNIAVDPYLACVLGDIDDIIAAVRGDPGLVSATTTENHVLGGGIMLLHLAVHYGHASLVELLLGLGAGVNARARSAAGHGESAMPGSTPLHVAAAAGRADMARLLIERGADVGATAGEQQVTPLAIAESLHADWIDRTEVARVLRRGGQEG